jgi:Flp pilus assembly protein TadG
MLLLLLVGVLDLGRIFYTYLQLTNAAREGARYGSNFPTDDAGMQAAAVNAAAGSGVSISSGDVSVSKTGTESGDSVTITIQRDFQLVTAYIFGVGTIHIGNSATMVVIPGGAP